MDELTLLRESRRRTWLREVDWVLDHVLIDDVLSTILRPYVDDAQEFELMVVSELVRERWEADDLYTLYHPRRSQIDVFYAIKSLGIKRECLQNMNERKLADCLSQPNSTLKIEIVQELHGYSPCLECYYAFDSKIIYEHNPWKPLSLNALLGMGVKLPINEDDRKRVQYIRHTIDPSRDFDWTRNEYTGKDVEDDPRGYRYKFGPNVYTLTCLHHCPFRWNFVRLPV